MSGLFVIGASNPITVSTTTVLMPWTKYVVSPGSILFYVINLDAVHTVNVTVDTTELPSFPDDDKATPLTITALRQGSVEIGQGVLRSWFRIIAATDGPSFPTALVRWGCRGWR